MYCGVQRCRVQRARGRADNLPREVRMLLDRFAGHERGHFDLVLVEQVEHARHAFLNSVIEEAVGAEIRIAALDRFGDRPSSFPRSAVQACT